jgi:hypothetical protein
MIPGITIVIKPAFNDRGRRHHDRFDAHLRNTGELVCRATRQPVLDGSRVLLARGYNPTDVIGMAWSHAPQIITITAVIGTAAQFDVMGEKFVRRRIDQRDPQNPRSGRLGSRNCRQIIPPT